jgi:potassium-transporting ATPase KdpC subunit
MRRDLISSLIAIVAVTVVLGLAYPLATTGVAQVLFPDKADGDMSLIGRDFSGRTGYFQSRPSATEYSTDVTFFNNLGPNNQELSDLFAENKAAYEEREQLRRGEEVPPDAVQTSASGVDPHISEANAEIQARRVAEERGLPLERVLELVEENTDGRFLGVLGEPGVNVLELNLALDDEAGSR